MLPVPIPAAVEQQRAQCGQRIARLLAPVASLSFLSTGDQEIIELLGVSTANVLGRDVPVLAGWLIRG